MWDPPIRALAAGAAGAPLLRRPICSTQIGRRIFFLPGLAPAGADAPSHASAPHAGALPRARAPGAPARPRGPWWPMGAHGGPWWPMGGHGVPWGTSVAADSRSVDAPEPRPAARPSAERAAPRPGRAASGPGSASRSPAKPKGPALRACLPPVVLGDHLVRLSPSARPRAGPRAPGSPAPGRCHAPPATARTVPAPAGATGPPAAAPPRRRPRSTTAPVRVA